MTTIQHFSHPEHSLALQDVCNEKAVCYGCKESIGTLQGSSEAAYTCTSTTCESIFLHKRCAESPTQINHPMHNQHPVTLVPSLLHRSFCDICRHKWDGFTYRCDDCDYDICILCTFDEDRVFHHISHKDHSLNLIRREALFDCDACGQEAKDSSYSCKNCDFWIHRNCAASTTTIYTPDLHHHPVQLIFAIPDVHRSCDRFCGKCKKLVRKNYWSYYCRECTYFVHIGCATSWETKKQNEKDQGTEVLHGGVSVVDLISALSGCCSC